MSTIVAVQKNGVACIAADSLTSFGETKQAAEFVLHSDKIIQFEQKELLTHIGIVGSAAHQIVLQSLMSKHPDLIDFSTRLTIFETLKNIHPILKEEYFLNSKEEQEDSYETSRVDALVINSYGIFGLYSLREVDQYSQFWAIGSGAEFALGAMYSCYDMLDSVQAIATSGIKAGATFDNSSAMPMTMNTVQLIS